MMFVLPLLIHYIFGSLDTLIRPFAEKESLDGSTLILLVLFFIDPFWVILSFYENQSITQEYFSFFDDQLVYFVGIIILSIGGVITFFSRIKLGRFGTGIITIERNHQLKTDGMN